MTRNTLLLVLCASSPMMQAQTTKSALAEVNAAFAGMVEFKIDIRDRLIMDCFDGSDRYRQDIARVSELDPASISYSEGEEGIVLNCIEGKSKCLSKEIFKMDMVRLGARSNIPCPANDPTGEVAIVLLKELLSLAQAELADLPNETSKKGSRRTER